MAELLMPKLGADMTSGILVAWLKKPGDEVRRGDVVAEIETDKGVIDVEAFITGVIEKLLVEPGVKAPVGAVLAVIRDGGAAAAVASQQDAVPVAAAAPIAVPAPTPIPRSETRTHVRASPSARDLARKMGVDLVQVTGTGPGGAITREDVERAGITPVRPPEPTAEDRRARMRQSIAAAMSRSKREIPHYYLSTTIDMHKAVTWLAQENLSRPVTNRLLPGVLLLKAVALALKEVPELNAVWENDHVEKREAVHVGVAIALRQGGLVAPAIHDTNRLGLSELMEKLRDLVNRARVGSLRSSEFSDPTITVTSLGDQGVEATFGIINPPQVAIVGFGKIVKRPWVVEDQVVPRSVVVATLSADHRVSDGHRGAIFLAAVDRLLQEPGKL